MQEKSGREAMVAEYSKVATGMELHKQATCHGQDMDSSLSLKRWQPCWHLHNTGN